MNRPFSDIPSSLEVVESKYSLEEIRRKLSAIFSDPPMVAIEPKQGITLQRVLCLANEIAELQKRVAITELPPEKDVVAYEFYNTQTGHSYVDYVRNIDREDRGFGDYIPKPLIYKY